MSKVQLYCCLLVLLVCFSCSHQKKDSIVPQQNRTGINKPPIIIDCKYSFEQAIKGTSAPKDIIDQLELVTVQYYSTDKKIHQGQILANKKIADRLIFLFKFMLQSKFPIARAIPIVKYNWDDEVSMEANNTSCFCYRDESFSKHAKGMAIDINPFFNPVRWKEGYKYHLDKPIGAIYNPAIPGTFIKQNPVVAEFKKQGFRWGHSFSIKYDDHHFEI